MTIKASILAADADQMAVVIDALIRQGLTPEAEPTPEGAWRIRIYG